MGPVHPTVTPASVYAEVHRAVSGVLAWSDCKACVTRVRIVDLLVYMAAAARTLSAAVVRRFPFRPETGRRAVHTQLPPAAELTAGLAAALHRVLAFSRLDRRRRTVAIDTHAVPDYGDRATPGHAGGPKKGGTHSFFGYATAVLLHRRRRCTVGLVDAAGLRPPEIVAALFAQIDAHRLAVKGVVLDSALGSEERMRVFAFAGWGGAAVAECRRARLARRRYRERFAIETSYRQKNARRGWTTGRDPRYRLLLEGIAHLLRQVWVLLTEAIARVRKRKPTDWIGDFTGRDPIGRLRERLERRDTASNAESRRPKTGWNKRGCRSEYW